MEFAGVENRITQPIYDTMQLLVAAAGVYPFFTIPLNGALTAAANKTYAHTNLVQAGRLEKGKSLVVSALSMYIRNTASGAARVTTVDYYNFYNETWLDLLIGETSFLRVPAQQVPAGVGEMTMFSNIAPAATEFQNGHGVSSVMNLYHLAEPLILEDQESVRVDVHVEDAIAAVTDVTVVLHGTQTRPVR